MNNFFNLTNIDSSYEISSYEKFIPIIIVIILISLIYIYQNKIRQAVNLDKYIRYTLGIISGIFLLIYYLILWSTEGFTVFNLPLHICFLSNIVCVILCFNKNKALFNFVIYTGVLGGISSLIAPTLDLSFKFFRYYQFMICHCTIIIIPIYFLIVYKYTVNFKETIKQIFVVEVLGLILGVINEIFNTTYMFVSFTSNNAARNSILYFIGEGVDYFINLQLLFLISMFLFYFILQVLIKKLITK